MEPDARSSGEPVRVTEQTADTIRVLFVEDAFDQALLVRTFLQPLGSFDITHSQDGDHAATLLRSDTWDLLITDLNLPGLDGFELCRIAKSENPTIPILAITGYTATHYQEEAFRAGATELLTKPLHRDEFVAKVAELTGTGDGPPRSAILAIGGLVGDVEMGCGGTLIRQAAAGAQVVIVPLCRDEMDSGNKGLAGADKAAQMLGARVVIDEGALDDTQQRMAIVEKLVADLRPRTVLFPAMDDSHPARREAFRIAKASTGAVPTLLGYQTATSGLDFRPSKFEDVSEHLMDKMEALTAYMESGANRLDLTPRMAQAYARYWGRMHRFAEVEPFEVIRGG
jgi:CheY-like chemotaxis protein/LmbE family N-acetylglucosaminyl deacetylase